MNIRKILLIISSFIVCAASATTVYFMYKNTVPEALNATYSAGAKTVSYEDTTLISQKTSIVKRIRYSKGIPVVMETQEEASAENLGMNKITASEYYKRSGFLITEFTANRVTMLKEISKWPPDYYILKADKGVINIYYTDAEGNMNFLKATELDYEAIPEEDQKDISKGIAFKTLQQIDNLLEEYDS